MKRKLSCITALLLSALLLATGCKNASQITFTDDAKGEFSKNGYSVVSVKVGETPEYAKTIWPSDWTEELKGQLVYVIKAAPTDPAEQPTQKETASNGYKFNYEQIIKGEAKIELDPTKWDFTLTAYQPTTLESLTENPNKPVMSATVANQDLAEGGHPIIFNLVAVKPDTDSAATGQLTIDLFFYNENDLDTVTSSFTLHSDKLLDSSKNTDGQDSKINLTGISAVTQDQWNGLTTEQSLAGGAKPVVGKDKLLTTQLNVPAIAAGVHTIQIVFKDKNSHELLTYEEKIVIDGGNHSTKNIFIPRGSYNRAPDAPEAVTQYCEYKPTTNRLTISNVSKKYAQEIASLDEMATDRYNLVLKWEDKAFNEKGFKLHMTTFSPDATKTKVGAITITNNGTDTPTITGVESPDINFPEVGTINKLEPSSESITLSLPTGIFCKDIYVEAYNDYGSGNSRPIANPEIFQLQKPDGTTEEIPASELKGVGIFTVAYDLVQPDQANSFATIKYFNDGSFTSKQYFVVGYNYGTTEDSIKALKNTAVYPFIESEKFNFSDWYFSDTKVTTPVVMSEINSLGSVAAQVGGVTSLNYNNQNITVKGSWTTTVGVQVNFPSYEGLKELQVTDKLMGEVMNIGNKEGTITIPEAYTISHLVFKVYPPAKGTDPSAAIYSSAITDAGGNTTAAQVPADGVKEDTAKKSITLTPADLLIANDAGIYRLYVSYIYSDNGHEVPIDGNLYIRISNDAKN